jgi:hypothetical protein
VCDTECLKLLNVAPGLSATAKSQSLVYEIRFHPATDTFLLFRIEQNAVAALNPRAAPTARQDEPADRRRLISARSICLRGRPRIFPLARAFRSPARTLSAMRLRSSSATAPRTVKTSFRRVVDVSICSDRLMPRDWHSPSGARRAETARTSIGARSQSFPRE